MTERKVERVRHELRFRVAEVAGNARITPMMARVRLCSPDLVGFRSLSYDDHVKLFFPEPGEEMPTPVPTERGLDFPGGRRPEARDYTPRAFDAAAGELTIDFVLHGTGPAATWAAAAEPGDRIGVGGPRASFVVRGDFDWYLLAGDETALPAIGRRIEELGGANVIAIVEVATAREEQALPGVRWLHRDQGESLVPAVRAAALPEGTGYAFVAGEISASQQLRAYLVEERGMNPDYVKAAGYWRQGQSDFDDGHAH